MLGRGWVSSASRVALGVASVAIVVAACHGGESNDSDGHGASPPGGSTTTNVGAPASTDARAVAADFFVTDRAFVGLPAELAAELSLLPEVGEVSPVRLGDLRIDGDPKTVACVDWSEFRSLIDVDPRPPLVSELSSDEVLVHEEAAAGLNLDVGDVVSAEGRDGSSGDLTVVGLFADDTLLGARWLVGLDATPTACTAQDLMIAGSIADSSNEDQAREAVVSVVDRYPDASVEWYSDFEMNG